MDYETAKQIAANGDDEARRQLAADDSAPTEILYYLATDESVSVRKTVAENIATPLQADFLLSNDTDNSIREDLATKIGSQLGAAAQSTDEAVAEKINKILENLVSDHLPTVRAIVAEEIKLLPNVPKGVINKLGRDTEAVVAIPILEHSPILDDEELINIISTGVRVEAMSAIARRANIGPGVSQSITNSGDTTAIGTLLENETATIEPGTMVEIAAIAEVQDTLHQPLANRNDLPESVIRRMATFVAESIVEDLISRYPLTDLNQNQLRKSVRTRIDATESQKLLSSAPSAKKKKVLLAEDDSIMRNLMRQIIEDLLKADVTAATDGREALGHLDRGEKFDLIISDWMMPTMTGIDLLRTIRARGDVSRFAMLTARKDVESIVAAQKYGVDAFIAKPVTAEQIRDKVKVLLR